MHSGPLRCGFVPNRLRFGVRRIGALALFVAPSLFHDFVILVFLGAQKFTQKYCCSVGCRVLLCVVVVIAGSCERSVAGTARYVSAIDLRSQWYSGYGHTRVTIVRVYGLNGLFVNWFQRGTRRHWWTVLRLSSIALGDDLIDL